MAAEQDPGCPDYPRFVRGRDSVLAYFNKLFRERIVIYDGVRACGVGSCLLGLWDGGRGLIG